MVIVMPRSIAVVDSDSKERRKLCAVLESGHYSAVPLQSLDDLAKAVQEGLFYAVILNLDSLPVNNSFFRNFRKLSPSVCVIGISNRPFHPELEESIRSHISACLMKPVQNDELIFWLKSVGAGESSDTED